MQISYTRYKQNSKNLCKIVHLFIFFHGQKTKLINLDSKYEIK
jgi:hypothetical protein